MTASESSTLAAGEWKVWQPWRWARHTHIVEQRTISLPPDLPVTKCYGTFPPWNWLQSPTSGHNICHPLAPPSKIFKRNFWQPEPGKTVLEWQDRKLFGIISYLVCGWELQKMTIPTKQAGGGYSQTQTVGLMDDSSFGIPNSVEFCKSSNPPISSHVKRSVS